MTDVRASRDPVAQQLVARLVGALAPERIYLFGSRARGDHRPDSDYDVLVLTAERKGEGRAIERAAYRALAGLGVSVDVVVMTPGYFNWMLGAKASLPSTVEREGQLLYDAA